MSRKSKSKKNAQVVATVTANVSARPSKRVRAKSKKRGRPGGMVPRWVHSVITPFARAGEGHKTPDGYHLGTTTVCLTQKLALTADSSGNFDLMLFPNLATSGWSTRSNLPSTSPTGIFALSGAPTVPPTVSQLGRCISFDIQALGNSYQTYRIVGWGARLRGVDGLNATGEIIAAAFPARGQVPMNSTFPVGFVNPKTGNTNPVPSYTYNVSASAMQDTVEVYLAQLGVPYSGTLNAAVVNTDRIASMVNHGTASYAQVAARGLHLRSFPFEADATRFRNVAPFQLGMDSFDGGYECSQSTTSYFGQQYSYNLDPWKLFGHESLIMGGSGFTANRQIGTLEIVYHLEVVPNPNLATLARSTALIPPPEAPAAFEIGKQMLVRVPRISFADVVQKAGDSALGYVEGQIEQFGSRAVDNIIGSLSRMLVGA